VAPFLTSNGSKVPLAAWLEDAWLQRYLDRQLDADETAWFEEYVVDKPHLLDRIDADSDLRDAVAGSPELRRPPAVTVLDVATTARAQPPAAAEVRHPAPRRRLAGSAYAIAAAIVAGIGIGWIVRQQSSPTAPGVIASPMRIVFDPERGAAKTPPRIEHARSDSAYVLIEAPVPPGASDIDLVIGGDASRVSPSADGFVSILVDRRKLQADQRALLRYRWQDAVREQRLELPAAATTRP
jgi:hypothetical protein